MDSKKAHIVVVGNEKGGSGKSTAAMHIIVALLQRRRSVAIMDLDMGQRTLSRYLENRRLYMRQRSVRLPLPRQGGIETSALGDIEAANSQNVERVRRVVGRLAAGHDVVVVDTPGNDAPLTRAAHALADTLITPLNDSFIDLDVLARVDPETMKITKPSRYAEMVWEQKKARAADDGGSIDWIVMRNRLTNLDARNKRDMARLLGELSARIGFRLVAGFSERVIYRELFLKGLTMMDIARLPDEGELTLSQVAARQEVRSLIDAVKL
jgi:chromosome partitioning protein